MNLSNLVRAAEKLKNKVLKTPMEQLLEEATSDENWNTPNKLLNEVAECSYSYQDQAVIMRHIENRLDTTRTKKWRKIEKTLGLMDYLVKYGAPRCTSEFRDIIYLVNKLKHHEAMENGQDKGAAIREKATNLAELLEDEERIKQVRAEAQALKEKLQNIGGINSRGSSKYSGMGSASYATTHKDTHHSHKDDLTEKYGGRQDLGSYDDYDWEKKIAQKVAKKEDKKEEKNDAPLEIQDQIKQVKETQLPPKKLIKIAPPSQPTPLQQKPVQQSDNLFDFDEQSQQQDDFTQFQQPPAQTAPVQQDVFGAFSGFQSSQPAQPTQQPFAQPTQQPFAQPTQQPFAQPTQQPFAQPTQQPFGQPAPQQFGQFQQQPPQQSFGQFQQPTQHQNFMQPNQQQFMPPQQPAFMQQQFMQQPPPQQQQVKIVYNNTSQQSKEPRKNINDLIDLSGGLGLPEQPKQGNMMQF